MIRTIVLVLAGLVVMKTDAVEPQLPSRTAITNLHHRALGAKNPDPEFRNPDYMAARFLGPREIAALPDAAKETLDLDYETALQRAKAPLPELFTSHLLRTRHIDARMQDALARGVRQIVILGAGYDSRAYRFGKALNGAVVFEVDFPPTQAWKKLRVKDVLGEMPGWVRWVAMDFNHDDLLTKLTEAGYSEDVLSFFIWEGVTYYLPESGVRDTLRFVRRHSAPGSAIIFDYTDSRNPNLNNPASRFARLGEPMIFGFASGAVPGFVRSEGLAVESDLDYEQLYDRYARRPDGSGAMPRPTGRTNLAGICIAKTPARPGSAGREP